ncbi:MAG: hypothetical protein ACLPSL_01005 [Smithella sp.]
MIHAILARIIGKEMIYLYCVPFGNTPVFIRSGKPATMPTKLAENRKRIPEGERIINRNFTLPVITACKVVITSKMVSILK